MKGEYTITCGGMGSLFLTVQWEEQVDELANTSTIGVTGFVLNAGVWAGRYYLNGTVSVNGTVVARMTNNAHQFYITSTGTPASETNGNYPYTSPAIAHNADGTGSATLSVNVSGSNATGGGQYYAAADIPVTLTAIPRASAVSAGEGTIGAPVTIKVTAASEGFRHTLRWALGEQAGVIGSDLQGGGTEWTPPMELCAALPDCPWGLCTITCDTYSGESLVGSSACETVLRVPGDVGLTFGSGWLTLAPNNQGTAAEALSCYVQGMSRLLVQVDETKITDENAYGGWLASVQVTVGGGAYAGTEVLRVSGKQTVAVTVTDSRGRIMRSGQQIQVLPYGAPVIGEAEAFRCTEDGTADDAGSCVWVKASCSVYGLEGRNTAVLTARLRTAGGDYAAEETLVNGEGAVLWQGLADPAVSYELAVAAVDSLGSSTSVTVTIPTASVFFHGRKGGTGAAFGKYAEEDDLLEIAWSLKTKGDLVVEGSAVIGGRSLMDWLYPVGSVCTVTEDVDPASVYGGQWEALGGEAVQWVRRG